VPSRDRGSRGVLLVAASVAVAVSLVLVIGYGVLGWGSSGASTPPPLRPASGLSITFAANSEAEVNFLLTTARPYIASNDSFDLVSGSPENSSLSVSNVNHEAQELHAAYPSLTIYAHTAGIDHYSEMTAGLGSGISGVLYDYEPGFEPEFTLNFSQTIANFENATALAHAHGLQSVGYPIGRLLLNRTDQQYGWNYATLSLAVDQMVLQVQTYCVQGPSTYSTAVETALGQYRTADLSTVPTFQITIGNATTRLPNGVTATPAFDCAQQLSYLGLHSLYLWWDQGGESNVIAFLEDLGR